ncbi:transposase [Pseudohalocynthiibacter aestuariivivens]|jgi:transposase|uniref:Transposase n=1 Tax=Pseudohalocynthiibacter aestuariivivens TaxID=1591409 RepID=A0ABV5JH09_9RHOB|nr:MULTISPECIES: transposase [Pseudohalocynthiibacter]MCK0104095.1 transposase [Pseudohalocynthiibacter sp. F2068]
MKRYVGIDVAQEQCALCIVDDAGTILFEGTCATNPDEIVCTIVAEVDDVEKIVHESGPMSIWLTRELVKRGAPVVCIDARAVHIVLLARMNKSDKSDAVGLAQLARTEWYGAVHVKSEASDQLRLILSARERLIRIRMDIEGQVRGLLKAYGIRLGPINAGYSRRSFRDQLGAAIKGDQSL